jgi:pseudaminic acid synthase
LTCKKVGNEQIALLKCTSAYPAPLEEMNLKTISDLSDKFKVIPGLSDHSLGTSIPIAAVSLGAKIIEKHFILDRRIGGPDSLFSLEPNEFKQMVTSIREVEKALGEVSYNLTPKVIKNREFARSLFIVVDIKEGDIITTNNVKSIRPGFGMSPKYLKDILGKKVLKNVKKGTPLTWDIIG